MMPKRMRAFLMRRRVSMRLRKLMARDRRRLLAHSGMVGDRADHLRARITYLYHALEKGLSFSSTRPGFGVDKVSRLLALMEQYRRVGDEGDSQYLSALEVLRSYRDHHRRIGEASPSEVEALLVRIDGLLNSPPPMPAGSCHEQIVGGTREVRKEEYLADAKGPFPSLCFSRSSVRHFAEGQVNPEDIRQAVAWARKSPSVCNRQAARVYAVSDESLLRQTLELQAGTRGFSDQIRQVLVVAGDLSAFLSPGERNQVFLDAGLFAMNLLYGLHYLGLGACILHWAMPGDKDDRLRGLLSIRPQDTVACMIAVGCLPESFRVAASQRLPLDEVLFPR
jgi:nitroreductase